MTTWEQIAEYATLAGAKFPECVAAQWALESGFGAHLSGKNNFFGIKGTPGTTVSTKEFIDGKWITIKDTFKDFTAPYDCVKYLVKRWYKDYGGYQGVNRANSREECAELLRVEGYATDPAYTEKLIKLMDDNVDENTLDGKEGFLEQAALYFAGEKHQVAAWRALEAGLSPAVLKAFKAAYRGSQAAPVDVGSKFPLDVAYFYQRDSKTGHGERSCFSSAMAMAIDYLDPEAIEGDDDYLNQVFKFGDTVSVDAQMAAAESLGLDVDFSYNASEQDLIDQLDKGIPVPIGILHKGTVSSPSGGGHYVCLIGYDEKYFHVHDPYGCLDLINGGYPKAGPTDGENQRYTRKNLMKRWLISSDHDGWAAMFQK
jgi:hypothetical protein